jgi:hypothetical protein
MADKMDLSTRYEFPVKLHGMLLDVEREKNEKIVSWMSHGRAFKVHDRHDFESKIMPLYFTEKYDSFRVLLGQWGFLRLSRHGKDRGAYFHKLFIKGKEHLVDGKDKVYMLAEMPTFLAASDEPDLYAIAEREDRPKKVEEPAEIPPASPAKPSGQKKGPPAAATTTSNLTKKDSSSSKASKSATVAQSITAVSKPRAGEGNLKQKEPTGKLSASGSKDKPKKKRPKPSTAEPHSKSGKSASKPKVDTLEKRETNKSKPKKPAPKIGTSEQTLLKKKKKKQKPAVSMDEDIYDDADADSTSSPPRRAKLTQQSLPMSGGTSDVDDDSTESPPRPSRLEILRNIPLCQYYLPPLQYSPRSYALPIMFREAREAPEPLGFLLSQAHVAPHHSSSSLHHPSSSSSTKKRKLDLAAATAFMTQKAKAKKTTLKATLDPLEAKDYRGVTMRDSGKWVSFY